MRVTTSKRKHKYTQNTHIQAHDNDEDWWNYDVVIIIIFIIILFCLKVWDKWKKELKKT